MHREVYTTLGTPLGTPLGIYHLRYTLMYTQLMYTLRYTQLKYTLRDTQLRYTLRNTLRYNPGISHRCAAERRREEGPLCATYLSHRPYTRGYPSSIQSLV